MLFLPDCLVKLLPILKLGSILNEFVPTRLAISCVLLMIPQKRDEFKKELGCWQSEMKQRIPKIQDLQV